MWSGESAERRSSGTRNDAHKVWTRAQGNLKVGCRSWEKREGRVGESPRSKELTKKKQNRERRGLHSVEP